MVERLECYSGGVRVSKEDSEKLFRANKGAMLYGEGVMDAKQTSKYLRKLFDDKKG